MITSSFTEIGSLVFQ